MLLSVKEVRVGKRSDNLPLPKSKLVAFDKDKDSTFVLPLKAEQTKSVIAERLMVFKEVQLPKAFIPSVVAEGNESVSMPVWANAQSPTVFKAGKVRFSSEEQP